MMGPVTALMLGPASGRMHAFPARASCAVRQYSTRSRVLGMSARDCLVIHTAHIFPIPFLPISKCPRRVTSCGIRLKLATAAGRTSMYNGNLSRRPLTLPLVCTRRAYSLLPARADSTAAVEDMPLSAAEASEGVRDALGKASASPGPLSGDAAASPGPSLSGDAAATKSQSETATSDEGTINSRASESEEPVAAGGTTDASLIKEDGPSSARETPPLALPEVPEAADAPQTTVESESAAPASIAPESDSTDCSPSLLNPFRRCPEGPAEEPGAVDLSDENQSGATQVDEVKVQALASPSQTEDSSQGLKVEVEDPKEFVPQSTPKISDLKDSVPQKKDESEVVTNGTRVQSPVGEGTVKDEKASPPSQTAAEEPKDSPSSSMSDIPGTLPPASESPLPPDLPSSQPSASESPNPPYVPGPEPSSSESPIPPPPSPIDMSPNKTATDSTQEPGPLSILEDFVRGSLDRLREEPEEKAPGLQIVEKDADTDVPSPFDAAGSLDTTSSKYTESLPSTTPSSEIPSQQETTVGGATSAIISIEPPSPVPIDNSLLPHSIPALTLSITLAGSFLFISSWLAKSGPMELIMSNNNPLREEILSSCPLLTSDYTPIPYLINRHASTIFAALFRRLPKITFRRVCLRMPDGGTVALDWPQGGADWELYVGDRQAENAPILILMPGLTGGSDDSYVRHMVLRSRQYGWRPVVFNSRGCADSPVTSPQFYSASFTEDTRQVIKQVGAEFPRARVYATGWSLGANILVRYLGQEKEATPLAGAVSLCNPFDLVEADREFQKGFNNLVYNQNLARGLSKIFRKHAALFEGIGGEYNLQMAAKCRTVREFDEAITRVSFGYPTVDAYYKDASSSRSIPDVKIPLLCIQAEDDPIAPAVGIPRQTIATNPNCVLLVTPSGGHLGWTAGPEAPLGAPWTDTLVMQYLEVLEASAGPEGPTKGRRDPGLATVVGTSTHEGGEGGNGMDGEGEKSVGVGIW